MVLRLCKAQPIIAISQCTSIGWGQGFDVFQLVPEGNTYKSPLIKPRVKQVTVIVKVWLLSVSLLEFTDYKQECNKVQQYPGSNYIVLFPTYRIMDKLNQMDSDPTLGSHLVSKWIHSTVL